MRGGVLDSTIFLLSLLAVRTICNKYFLINLLAVPDVTAITATPTGIMWSPPSGAPPGCSSQYIVSGLTDGSNVTLLVTGNNAASVDLKRRGFTPCVDQDITVTPILTIRNETLPASSATERVVIPDPGEFLSMF